MAGTSVTSTADASAVDVNLSSRARDEARLGRVRKYRQRAMRYSKLARLEPDADVQRRFVVIAQHYLTLAQAEELVAERMGQVHCAPSAASQSGIARSGTDYRRTRFPRATSKKVMSGPGTAAIASSFFGNRSPIACLEMVGSGLPSALIVACQKSRAEVLTSRYGSSLADARRRFKD